MIDSMYWTCGEVLSLAAQLADARDLPAPDVLKRRIATLLDDMDRRGLEAGITKRDLDEAKYAIVAFVDEQLFRAPWQGRQQWMLEPLQLVYFNENTAGEGFFERVDTLERDPSRLHVLQVYYLCLALGFQGKYAVRGGDGLAAVMERLSGAIGRALPFGDVLSPHGVPPDANRGRARREAPVYLLAGGLVAVAILVFFVLRLTLGSATSDATAQMKAATVGTAHPAKVK